MTDERIYLDHNATTPVLPEVVETVASVLTECNGNPSSTHAAGRRSRGHLDDARKTVARCVGAEPSEIVFTASGSEANNIAVRGTALRAGKGAIVTSAAEHPSVEKTCDRLESEGFTVRRIPVGTNGRVDGGEFVEALAGGDVILATLIHAQNETGILQPVRQVGAACRDRAIPFHSDTAQSAGKLPLDVRKDPIDMLTIVGHKFHAPKGVGALFAGRDAGPGPVIYGGGQERGLRPGTENVALAAGLAKAFDIVTGNREEEAARIREMRDRFEEEVTQSLDGVIAVGRDVDRLPGTSMVLFDGLFGFEMAAKLDEAGIEVSTGSACHSGSPEPSEVLVAMGIDPELAVGAIRVGFGRVNTMDHVARLVDRMIRIAGELRK